MSGIEVEGPDGSIHEFPDGTTPDVIKSAMAKAYPAIRQARPQDGASNPGYAPAFGEYAGLPMQGDEALANTKKVFGGLDDAARSIANGATFGFADKLAAAGNSLASGGSYADAIKQERARSEAVPGAIKYPGEVAGALASGKGLMDAGVTATRFLPQGASGISRLLGLSGAGAVDGAALGALSGAGHTDDGNYAGNIKANAALGGLIGGAAPAIVAGVGKVISPIKNAVQAQLFPEKYTANVAKGLLEKSGETPDAIRARLLAAAQDGQADYVAADALGTAGARVLNGIARGNDRPAFEVKDFLDSRQMGQGDRLENILRGGLGSRYTSSQLEDKISGIRGAQAAKQYAEARAGAGPVDVAPAVRALDAQVPPIAGEQMVARGIFNSGPTSKVLQMKRLLTDEPVGGAKAEIPAGLEGLSGRAREQVLSQLPVPKAVNVSDFERAFLAKREIDAAMEKGGATSAFLAPARTALDDALAASSPRYSTARDTYKGWSQLLNAIERGKQIASRGLSQDTTSAISELSPAQMKAARAGYVDELLKRVQAAPEATNKARSLTSGKYQTELPRMAMPENADQMMRALDREGQMFATRQVATGGSQTANNLADLAMVGAGAGSDLLGYADHGLQGGLSLALLRRGIKSATSNPSQEARAYLAKLLMSRNGDDLASIVARQVASKRALEQSVAPAIGGLLSLTPGSYSR